MKECNFIPSDSEVLNYVPNVLLKKRSIEQVVEEALDYAHCHGLAMRLADSRDKSDVCQSAPLALFPSPFPAKLYQQAVEVQNAMLELYFRLAWDHDFLVEAHKEVIKTDEFIRKMVEIYEKVWASGVPQTKTLITQRADYMCNVAKNPEGELKQIEVNNIAVSMGGLAQRVTAWHRKILMELVGECPAERVPVNGPVETLAEGLYHAWLSMHDRNAAVLVVVENANQNQLDQRFIEYELAALNDGPIKIIRATLGQCYDRLSLKDKDLMIDGSTRVTVVYFRSGYGPEHYPTNKEWDARLVMEQSNAIKCPWIGLQLANTKKVQQVLDNPGVVEKHFPEEPARVQQIRATFAGLWGLDGDDEQTKQVIADAIANPDRYVLKPQLEGGGGNYYGAEIPEKLKSLSKVELSAHILMEKIQPLVVKNVLVRALQPVKVSDVVSELGIYGFLFGESDKIQRVYSHGHILRTKANGVNEGGIAVGASVVDSPFLF
uniref:Glutathione synthetase n=1 Tax=Panagrolaimus sp. JU765 TaxID=591449 RepID=A0AC34QMD2_9BILA